MRVFGVDTGWETPLSRDRGDKRERIVDIEERRVVVEVI